MAISCKNCGSYFTQDELAKRKPPVHSWPLTAVGARVLEENRETGEAQFLCPHCGCGTLRFT